jgi:hypothetical protein
VIPTLSVRYVEQVKVSCTTADGGMNCGIQESVWESMTCNSGNHTMYFFELKGPQIILLSTYPLAQYGVAGLYYAANCRRFGTFGCGRRLCWPTLHIVAVRHPSVSPTPFRPHCMHLPSKRSAHPAVEGPLFGSYQLSGFPNFFHQHLITHL